LQAARRSVWLKDPAAPVDLQDEDLELFSMYLKCVYLGIEAIKLDIQDEVSEDPTEEGEGEQPDPDAFELTNIEEYEEEVVVNHTVRSLIGMLVKLYILADKLGDPATANMVIDELVRFHAEHHLNPNRKVVNFAYESTVHGNPLRKFLRDVYLHQCASDVYDYFNIVDFHADFYRDLYVEYLRIRDANAGESVKSAYNRAAADLSDKTGKCRYHQHDDEHPVCTPAQ
jgi:hypothetical protein